MGDLGSILPREGHGYPLQYSCLGNFTEEPGEPVGAHGITGSDMTERLTQTHNLTAGGET